MVSYPFMHNKYNAKKKSTQTISKFSHTTTDCPKKNYNRHLGIDCNRTLYGIRKIKPDYETMTTFLQFSEDPIWFREIIAKKYGFL